MHVLDSVGILVYLIVPSADSLTGELSSNHVLRFMDYYL
jgi:hypothetical protein